MKICFPVRKQNGSEYSTLEEVMGVIGREPHGSWLAGTNQLWHGGFHVSEVSAPGSVLTADNIDTAVPLQCMVQGEVVAWRLNQDYRKADYNGKALQYSSTFVLVKSICKPDPDKANSWLEFYSLYMGLAPLSVYPKRKCMKATTTVIKHPAGKCETSASADGVADISSGKGELSKDSRVIILRETLFKNKGATQPFGLAKMLNAGGEATGEAFWVTMLPEYMAPDGEQYAQMPAWMQKANAQGMFDSVSKPSAKLEMEAGEAIGFLAEDIAPAGKSQVTSSHFSHIEVISSDARMPDFLNNPGQVTSGQKFIRLHPEADLYTRSGSGEQTVFTKTGTKTPKDSTKILRVADCSPFEDAQHQTWFKVSGHSWMNQSGIDQINQYDLKERGFSPLEQDASPDVSKSLRENWVKWAYDWLSAQVGQAQGIHEKQVSAFYKAMVKKTDSDGDGQLTGRELYNALHHPEAGVRDIAARLVVKHDSEWFGGSSHHRWSVFFQNYDRLRMAYARQWLDDCEWMSKVEAFRSGAPVWHFHPVMFLDALNNMSLPVTPVNGKLEPLDFITFYKGDSIDDADYQLAATSLSCEVAAIKAVAQTETGNYGSYFKFQSDDDYVPAILFERHHFSKYTHGAYDSQTDISNSDAGGYGAISTQYPKLVRAYALNKRAALMSASWGKFQILGSNYAAAGYSSPEAFVMAMSESEKNQLKAFVAFIKFDATLLTSIRNKDWLTFARAYNGKKQKGYDKKM